MTPRRRRTGGIDRRTLFRYGAAGGAVAVAGRAVLPKAAAREPERAKGTGFELEEATVAGLQKRMETGQDTARSLVEKYAARIEALDRRGPSLRSVLEV